MIKFTQGNFIKGVISRNISSYSNENDKSAYDLTNFDIDINGSISTRAGYKGVFKQTVIDKLISQYSYVYQLEKDYVVVINGVEHLVDKGGNFKQQARKLPTAIDSLVLKSTTIRDSVSEKVVALILERDDLTNPSSPVNFKLATKTLGQTFKTVQSSPVGLPADLRISEIQDLITTTDNRIGLVYKDQIFFSKSALSQDLVVDNLDFTVPAQPAPDSPIALTLTSDVYFVENHRALLLFTERGIEVSDFEGKAFSFENLNLRRFTDLVTSKTIKPVSINNFTYCVSADNKEIHLIIYRYEQAQYSAIKINVNTTIGRITKLTTDGTKLYISTEENKLWVMHPSALDSETQTTPFSNYSFHRVTTRPYNHISSLYDTTDEPPLPYLNKTPQEPAITNTLAYLNVLSQLKLLKPQIESNPKFLELNDFVGELDLSGNRNSKVNGSEVNVIEKQRSDFENPPSQTDNPTNPVTYTRLRKIDMITMAYQLLNFRKISRPYVLRHRQNVGVSTTHFDIPNYAQALFMLKPNGDEGSAEYRRTRVIPIPEANPSGSGDFHAVPNCFCLSNRGLPDAVLSGGFQNPYIISIPTGLNFDGYVPGPQKIPPSLQSLVLKGDSDDVYQSVTGNTKYYAYAGGLDVTNWLPDYEQNLYNSIPKKVRDATRDLNPQWATPLTFAAELGPTFAISRPYDSIYLYRIPIFTSPLFFELMTTNFLKDRTVQRTGIKLDPQEICTLPSFTKNELSFSDTELTQVINKPTEDSNALKPKDSSIYTRAELRNSVEKIATKLFEGFDFTQINRTLATPIDKTVLLERLLTLNSNIFWKDDGDTQSQLDKLIVELEDYTQNFNDLDKKLKVDKYLDYIFKTSILRSGNDDISNHYRNFIPNIFFSNTTTDTRSVSFLAPVQGIRVDNVGRLVYTRPVSSLNIEMNQLENDQNSVMAAEATALILAIDFQKTTPDGTYIDKVVGIYEPQTDGSLKFVPYFQAQDSSVSQWWTAFHQIMPNGHQLQSNIVLNIRNAFNNKITGYVTGLDTLGIKFTKGDISADTTQMSIIRDTFLYRLFSGYMQFVKRALNQYKVLENLDFETQEVVLKSDYAEMKWFIDSLFNIDLETDANITDPFFDYTGFEATYTNTKDRMSALINKMNEIFADLSNILTSRNVEGVAPVLHKELTDFEEYIIDRYKDKIITIATSKDERIYDVISRNIIDTTVSKQIDIATLLIAFYRKNIYRIDGTEGYDSDSPFAKLIQFYRNELFFKFQTELEPVKNLMKEDKMYFESQDPILYGELANCFIHIQNLLAKDESEETTNRISAEIDIINNILQGYPSTKGTVILNELRQSIVDRNLEQANIILNNYKERYALLFLEKKPEAPVYNNQYMPTLVDERGFMNNKLELFKLSYDILSKEMLVSIKDVDKDIKLDSLPVTFDNSPTIGNLLSIYNSIELCAPSFRSIRNDIATDRLLTTQVDITAETEGEISITNRESEEEITRQLLLYRLYPKNSSYWQRKDDVKRIICSNEDIDSPFNKIVKRTQSDLKVRDVTRHFDNDEE